MGKNDSPTLLVPLLALLAILFPFAASVRSPSSPAEKTPQTKQPTAPEPNLNPPKDLPRYSAANLIEDFLHDRHDRKTGWSGKDPRSKYSLHFMIATVPDPVDSRLPYFFDSFLDSIQRAFEADKYVLDRYHLAWSEPPTKGVDAEAAKKPDMPRYRWRPSLLLFRKPATDTDVPERDLFLVFLVGETPTSGLHKAAMAGALRQLGDFFPWGPGYKMLPDELHNLRLASSEIKIMGPTFSGSAISLDFALRDWLASIKGQPEKLGEPLPTFRIVSGTATAMDPDDFYDISAGDTFQAVVPPDSDTIGPILGYIRKLGTIRGRNLGYARIAMLTEANTAYGRQDLDKNKDKDTDVSVINLPFPMHISELRAASEKQRLSQQKMSSPVYSNPTPPIPIEEGESSQPKETPPSYSDLEVSSAELVLSRLLSTISNEGYHAVGIMATDVRDTIFLAREIHQHCPDTLVFTVNSDLFYMHPDVGSSTRGMLVFTPYPLFNLDQVWTRPFWGKRTRLQFPSQAAEGVYNATLALLGQEGQMLDYGRPFQSHGPEDPAKPALWVTVMGQDGPLPVELLDWEKSDSGRYSLLRKTQQSKPERIDWSGIYTENSTLVILFLSAALFAFSLLVIRQYSPPARSRRERRLSWASRLFNEPVTPEYRSQTHMFLLVSLVGSLSFYVVAAAAYLLPAIASYRVDATFNVTGWRWLVALALAAGLLPLAGAAIVVLFAFCKERRRKSLLPFRVKFFVLAGSAFMLFLSGWLVYVWLSMARTNTSKAIFTYVRAFDFSSGLSPLVPLFCVALAGLLWAFCAFRRLRTTDGMWSEGGETGHKNCFLSAITPSLMGVRTLEANVWDLLENASIFPARWSITLIVAGLFFAMYAYLFFSPFVPSYEGYRFYFLFGWAFLLVYASLSIEFARLYLAWRALRRLLQRLAVHPMQAAYGRYQKKFPGLPRIDLAIPVRTYAVLSFSVDQAEQLLRLASSPIPPVTLSGNATASSPVPSSIVPGPVLRNLNLPKAQKTVQDAARNLSEALEEEANGDWRLAIEKRSKCQDALGDLCRQTAVILESSWGPKTTPAGATPGFQAFRELGEEFLVGRTVLLLSYVLPALRNLGAFVLSGLLLMLFSVISYPFLQRNHFLAFNWIVILVFVGLALLVMLQMERDAVLSSLNGTKPGQVTLTRQFTLRFLTYVMIPILALLGAQFPDTVGRIISWLGSTPGR